jgi:glycosyltransferase involved in cell wall biosynthesis
MKIRFIELAEPLREGGLEKAAADMAHTLKQAGARVVRDDTLREIAGDTDIVHFHGLWAPGHLKLAAACRKRRIPVVVSPHGMLEPWAWKHRRWKKWPYFHLFEKRRLGRATALLATAEAEGGNLAKFFPSSRIDVLPLGIEPEVQPDFQAARDQLGWPAEETVLLYLSRVHPKKGLKELLESLLAVAGKVPLDRARLVIVGNGPEDYAAVCRNLVARLKPLMTVEWIGPQWGTAKWPYLQGADLFCLPTYSENFGIVVLEAGIVGTPVFTTTGTPWKGVEEAGFGWVVDPHADEYERVLKEFLEMPAAELAAKRPAFSDWTRARYAWPNLAGRYLAFYESLMSPGGKGGPS